LEISHQKVEIFDILGRIPTRLHRLTWNFAQPSGPRCPSILQSVTWIGATSRPDKPDFWPVSKNNTGSLPLSRNPAGKKNFKNSFVRVHIPANDTATDKFPPPDAYKRSTLSHIMLLC